MPQPIVIKSVWGQPVPSPKVTTQMERVAAFRPGYWNMRNFSPQFVQQLYDNFQRFSTPDRNGNVFYSPYLNINHSDELRFGRITRAELKNGVLYLWADRMPIEVAQWINSHMLAERSIEFIEPKMVNGELRGFTGPDGKVVKGPVLKCLSLLGSDIPAVKGLQPLPVATFRDHNTGGLVLKFSTRAFTPFTVRRFSQMNPQLVQQLQALGIDTTGWPQDLPDAVLQSIIAGIQAAIAAAGNPNPNPNGNGQTGQMAGNTPTIQIPSVTPNNGGGANGMPSNDVQSLTLKFNDMMGQYTRQLNANIQAMLAPVNLTIAQIRQQNIQEAAERKRLLEKDRDSVLSKFFDRMGTEGRIDPDERAVLEPPARKMEFSTVRKFADGKTEGTELDEYLAGIERTHPVKRNMNGGNRGGSGNTGDTKPPRVPARPVNQDTTAPDPDRVSRIMGGSQLGRTILAKRAAAARNN